MTRGEYLLACRCRSSYCWLAASWLLERLDREGVPKTHACRVRSPSSYHRTARQVHRKESEVLHGLSFW